MEIADYQMKILNKINNISHCDNEPYIVLTRNKYIKDDEEEYSILSNWEDIENLIVYNVHEAQKNDDLFFTIKCMPFPRKHNIGILMSISNFLSFIYDTSALDSAYKLFAYIGGSREEYYSSFPINNYNNFSEITFSISSPHVERFSDFALHLYDYCQYYFNEKNIRLFDKDGNNFQQDSEYTIKEDILPMICQESQEFSITKFLNYQNILFEKSTQQCKLEVINEIKKMIKKTNNKMLKKILSIKENNKENIQK